MLNPRQVYDLSKGGPLEGKVYTSFYKYPLKRLYCFVLFFFPFVLFFGFVSLSYYNTIDISDTIAEPN